MPEDTYPPDLEVAGAGQPPAPAGGMIDALRSQGTPPAGLMEALRPPTLTPASHLAYAAAAGLNPTGINPIERQQNIQQEMAMQQVQLIQRAQEHAQKQALEKNKAAFEVLSHIVADPNTTEDVMKAIGPQFQQRAKEFYGIDIPASALQKVVPQKDRNAMLQDLYEGFTPAQIQKNYPWVKAEDIPQYMAMLQKPEVLKRMGIATPEDMEMKKLDRELKVQQILEKKYPQGSKEFQGETMRIFRNLFGYDYTDPRATGEQKSQAESAAADAELQREREKTKYSADLQLRNVLAGIDRRQESQQQKPLTITQKIALKKDMEAADSHVKLLRNIDMMKSMADNIDNAGLLPKGNSLMSAGTPFLTRQVWQRYNPDWIQFQQLWGPLSVGQIDRGLYDEKGVRSIQAFAKQLGVTSDPPNKKALLQYLDFVRGEVMDAGMRRIKTMRTTGFPQEVVDDLEASYRALENPAPQKKEEATGRGPLNSPASEFDSKYPAKR